MVKKGELIQQIILIIRNWPDDWPTHDDICFELKRQGYKITRNITTNFLNHYIRRGYHERLDSVMQKRVVRAEKLNFITKAVLFAIRDGPATSTINARVVSRIARQFDPDSIRIHSHTLPHYIATLKKLAKTDKEVEEILKKLKS